jgi:3-deoxy-D-manno-octulosonic-acid transferase
MMLVLDILYLLSFIFYFPFLVMRGRWHEGFSMRFGRIPEQLQRQLAGQENIWVHAVSVGEVALVEGLIRELQQRFPSLRVVLSVSTISGYAFAAQRYPDLLCIWAPLDLSWAVSRYVTLIRPRVYVVAETELWPNLFSRLQREGVAIVLINGRISDKAFCRYRAVRWLLKPTLLRIAKICVQSRLDAERFIALGARKAQVEVAGNIKFDVIQAQIPADPLMARQRFGFRKEELVLVGASTHPGEEEVVAKVFQKLSLKFHHLRLVIVPRHPQRAVDVAAAIEKLGLQPVFFSTGMNAIKTGGGKAVLLVDTVGVLFDLYRVADVVIIGKSFGIPGRGGQNPIEAASLGKPVIVGPHMENFRDVMRLFNDAGAIIEVPGPDALAAAVDEVLSHPQRMAGLCVRAKIVVEQNAGAARRSADAVASFL